MLLLHPLSYRVLLPGKMYVSVSGKKVIWLTLHVRLLRWGRLYGLAIPVCTFVSFPLLLRLRCDRAYSPHMFLVEKGKVSQTEEVCVAILS